jgi:hypothetical protein
MGLMMMIELPEYALVIRTLSCGMHPYRSFLSNLEKSPVARRIEKPDMPLKSIIDAARVLIKPGDGYVWVDVKIPAITLIEGYYRNGSPIDLYLDLAHELTHLRQLAEGKDLWDNSLHYVDRPTEIEGYAVAVEEGLRLGLKEDDIIRHLSNPWMNDSEVARLRSNIDQFLAQNP